MTTNRLGEHVRKISTADTGGRIILDFLTLQDGTLLVISDDLIALYASQSDFDDGTTLGAPKELLWENCIVRPQR